MFHSSHRQFQQVKAAFPMEDGYWRIHGHNKPGHRGQYYTCRTIKGYKKLAAISPPTYKWQSPNGGYEAPQEEEYDQKWVLFHFPSDQCVIAETLEELRQKYVTLLLTGEGDRKFN